MFWGFKELNAWSTIQYSTDNDNDDNDISRFSKRNPLVENSFKIVDYPSVELPHMIHTIDIKTLPNDKNCRHW